MSLVYPEGVLEDVLVQVNQLVFPNDIYVLDMCDEHASNSYSLLLGRPFLVMASTKIDVQIGMLSMEFDDKIVKFNMYDDLKYPCDAAPYCVIDVIDDVAEKALPLYENDGLQLILSESLGIHGADTDFTFDDEFNQIIWELNDLKSVGVTALI